MKVYLQRTNTKANKKDIKPKKTEFKSSKKEEFQQSLTVRKT